MIRSFHHSCFPPDRLVSARREAISVCVPAREEAATIGPIVQTLVDLRDAGAIDEVVVIDADSADETAELAAGAGATVYAESTLLPEFGSVLGKGDAMWRSLSVLSGEIVCFVDGDTHDFGAHFACGLAGAVACEPGVEFAKAFYRRPFSVGEVTVPDGGGRVTELTARPLLERFYPALDGIRQPLAGEIAARRSLLERLPFGVDYSVEIGMLLDVHHAIGPEGIAQVDLDVRRNQHQSLDALGSMASAVLGAVAARLAREGRLEPTGGGPAVERPPMATLRSAV